MSIVCSQGQNSSLISRWRKTFASIVVALNCSTLCLPLVSFVFMGQVKLDWVLVLSVPVLIIDTATAPLVITNKCFTQPQLARKFSTIFSYLPGHQGTRWLQMVWPPKCREEGGCFVARRLKEYKDFKRLVRTLGLHKSLQGLVSHGHSPWLMGVPSFERKRERAGNATAVRTSSHRFLKSLGVKGLSRQFPKLQEGSQDVTSDYLGLS